MRITNSMMVNNYNRDLNMNMSRMAKIQTQVETNKRITRLSDDPVGIVSSLRARSKIADLEIYRKNIADGQSFLTAAETAINDLNSTMKRVYELTVDLSNGTKTAEDRQQGAKEIKELMEHVVSTLNTTYNEKQVFGSFNFTSIPFEVRDVGGENRLFFNGLDIKETDTSTPAGLANAAALAAQGLDVAKYEIDKGIRMEVSLTGLALMGTGDGNTYDVLNKLYNELMSPDSSAHALDLMIKDIQNCQSRLLDGLAEIGGRANRLDMLDERFSADEINYEELRSKIEDLDTAEGITALLMAESVYKAALGVGSRVIQPTLVDFMR